MRTYASIYAESISVSAVFKSLLQAPQQQQRPRLYRVSHVAPLSWIFWDKEWTSPTPSLLPTPCRAHIDKNGGVGLGLRVFTLNIYELRNRASVKTGTDASPS